MMRTGLPPVKIPKARPPNPILPAPQRPRIDSGDEAEILSGVVQNKKASAPEERFARAISEMRSVDTYQFRYTVGAPRGLPGWKELDFLVSSRNMLYAIEVDSTFTHRGKSGRSDVLHDAIILKELKKRGMEVWPSVIHLDMETDLVDQRWAGATAKRLFG